MIALTFRQDESRFILALRMSVFVAAGGLLAWFFSRVLVSFIEKFTARIQRRLGAGALVAVLALAAAGGREVVEPGVPVPACRPVPGFPGRRVLMVGVDGANWKVVDRLFAEDQLPALKRLVGQGVRAEIYSPPPQVSPAVWTTIVSGQPKNIHGVEQYLLIRLRGVRPFAFEALANDKMLLGFFWVGLVGYLTGMVDGIAPFSDQVRAPRLWEMAGAAGLKVVLAGWPVTWPARSVNGLLISDGFGPGEFDVFMKNRRERDSLVYPGEALGWIEELTSEPDPENLSQLGALSGLSGEALTALRHFRYNRLLPAPALLLEKILAADISRLRIVEESLRRFQPRLVLLTLNSADLAMHAFWPDRFPADFDLTGARHPEWGRLIDDTLGLIDRGLEQLLAAVPEPKVIVVVSDHGMSPRPGNLVWPSWHDERALLAISGEPFRKGMVLEKADYLDILPTVLYLLGLEVPASLPGRVLEEAIEPDFLNRYPPRRAP